MITLDCEDNVTRQLLASKCPQVILGDTLADTQISSFRLLFVCSWAYQGAPCCSYLKFTIKQYKFSYNDSLAAQVA